MIKKLNKREKEKFAIGLIGLGIKDQLPKIVIQNDVDVEIDMDTKEYQLYVKGEKSYKFSIFTEYKCKYLSVCELDDGTILPIGLCCGIVDIYGNVTIPEHTRKSEE